MAKMQTTISAARCEIHLLRQYRTRLIVEVVAGKVDVRDVAAHLPVGPAGKEKMDSNGDTKREAFVGVITCLLQGQERGEEP